MGRFESAVDFYQYREPYPAQFFQAVAGKLKLSKQTRALDVGCGPGNLAIGFAPFVGFCEAIDLETEMLRAARETASEAGVSVDFKQIPIEEFVPGEGPFDCITIGRAIHWFDRDAALTVFERIGASNARIAVCTSMSSSASWVERFRQLRREWSGDPDESRYRPDLEQWFAPSRFRKLDEIIVTEPNPVTIENLVKRALSFSTTSPAALGDRRAAFEAELRRRLQEYESNGIIQEEITAKAVIFG